MSPRIVKTVGIFRGVVLLFWTLFCVIVSIFLFMLYHSISRFWAKGCVWIAGIELEVHGLENVVRERNYVFVSNHASHLDIPILLSVLSNEVKMIAKKELARIPFFGLSLWLGGYIFIDRRNRSRAILSMEQAVEKIKKGKSVLMFPEGTRSPDGSIQPLKKGAFVLAIQSQVELLPIMVFNSNEILPKSHLGVRPGKVIVFLSEAISTKGLTMQDRNELLKRVEKLWKQTHKDCLEKWDKTATIKKES